MDSLIRVSTAAGPFWHGSSEKTSILRREGQCGTADGLSEESYKSACIQVL